MQSLLLHDDTVSAYARKWEEYRIASNYTNVICAYLNRMLVKMKNPHSNSGGLGGDSRYRKMSIEAVRSVVVLAQLSSFQYGGRGSCTVNSYIPIHLFHMSQLAFAIWKDRVLFEINHGHSNRLMYQLLAMVRRDRDGHDISTDVARKCILSYGNQVFPHLRFHLTYQVMTCVLKCNSVSIQTNLYSCTLRSSKNHISSMCETTI